MGRDWDLAVAYTAAAGASDVGAAVYGDLLYMVSRIRTCCWFCKHKRDEEIKKRKKRRRRRDMGRTVKEGAREGLASLGRLSGIASMTGLADCFCIMKAT